VSSALYPCHSWFSSDLRAAGSYNVHVLPCHVTLSWNKNNWPHWNTESTDDWWVSVTKSTRLQVWDKIVLIDGTCATYLGKKYKIQPSAFNELTGLLLTCPIPGLLRVQCKFEGEWRVQKGIWGGGSAAFWFAVPRTPLLIYVTITKDLILIKSGLWIEGPGNVRTLSSKRKFSARKFVSLLY